MIGNDSFTSLPTNVNQIFRDRERRMNNDEILCESREDRIF